MPRDPLMSAIVVHYQSPFSLQRCLASLHTETLRQKLEIIVVDNASPDWEGKTWKKLFPKVRYVVQSRNGGYAVAANEGIRHAKGSSILLLNADTVLLPGAAKALKHCLDTHKEAGLIGSKILDRGGRLQLSFRSFPCWWTPFFSRYSPLTLLWPRNPYSDRYLHSRDRHQSIREVDWVSGACMLLRRDAFLQIGGFDEQFFLYMEDVDLCMRLHQAGWKVFYEPKAVVMHAIGSASAQRKVFAIVEHHRSIWRYYKKYFQRGILKDLLIIVGLLARCGLEVVEACLKRLFFSQGEEAYREALLKRPIDIALSLLGLLLTFPLWSVSPALIWLQDRGPIFYRQPRMGRNGQGFHVLKFRTMVDCADRVWGPAQAQRQDPRVTPLGRWLRRAAIDELPQLINILIGEMSLVGPRALLPTEIETGGDGRAIALRDVPGWDRRALLRPGLTGIAQVFARRDLPRRQKFRYDLLYARGRSVFFDFKMILLSAWISLIGGWEKRGKETPRKDRCAERGARNAEVGHSMKKTFSRIPRPACRI